jgi:hypothetical protein
MMDNKRMLVIAGLVVLAVAAWLLVRHLNAVKVDPVVVDQLNWKFVSQGVDPDTQGTTTRVYLTVAGVDVSIGGYRGDCRLVDGTSTPLLSGEVSGVICSRGVEGKEIGIFNDGGKLVLKEGDVVLDTKGIITSRTNFVQREGL